MARGDNPQPPSTHRPFLRLLEPPAQPMPVPFIVPLLRPDHPVTPAQDAFLTRLARQAGRGDQEARELLWRAFGPRLEPALRRCGRMTWRPDWARRNGRPWELDDLRQEAWLVFSELVDGWNEEGSFVPYATAYFPWRLRNAMRRLEPPRRGAPLAVAAAIGGECQGLHDAESDALLRILMACLSTEDAMLLRMRVGEGAAWADIACRLGVSPRTVARRWTRVQRVTRRLLTASRGPARSGPGGS